MIKPPDPTLVLFCRRPALGVGKQRIAAATDARFALELGERLLAAALEDAAAWQGPVVLAAADPADVRWLQQRGPATAVVVAQPTGNLGERLAAVDSELRHQGQSQLHFIGSDAPLLDPDYYAQARRALAAQDVVLGPAEDGGVTLMGSRVAWPALADLPWSSGELGTALDQRCRSRGLAVHQLAPSYDCDTVDVLPRLATDLARDPRPARQALRRWLVDAALPALGVPERGR